MARLLARARARRVWRAEVAGGWGQGAGQRWQCWRRWRRWRREAGERAAEDRVEAGGGAAVARAAPCLCPIGAWLKPHSAGRRVKSSGKSRRSKPSDHLQAALCTGGGASGQSRETGWAGHPAHPTRRPPPRLCHRLCRVRCARARACASSLQQRAASSWRQVVDVQAVGSSAQVFGAGIEGRSAGGRSAGARRALGGQKCGSSP